MKQKKLLSKTDVITNSSSETYVIRKDAESEFPCDNYSWGSENVFSLETIKEGTWEVERSEYLDILENLGVSGDLIYPEGVDRSFFDQADQDDTKKEWSDFVSVNSEVFSVLLDYGLVYGPEDHYEDYEDDWSAFRKLSVYTWPRG